MIRVRLFAALREEAGSSWLEVDAPTAGALVDGLAARYGERFEKIAAAGTIVVNGERASRATVLADGDEVALLPPVSGG